MQENIETRLVLTNMMINRHILANNIDPLKFKFSDFTNDYTLKNKIELDENIPRIEEDFFLGVTVKSPYTIKIFLNPLLKGVRKNFSLCHEIAHCMYDLNKTEETQRFFNFENKPSFYSPKELIIENLANASAGVTMLPDITIIKYLETNISFPKLAETLSMSQAALYVRLVQFLEQQLEITNENARKYINELRYYGKKEALNRLLVGAYSKINKKKEIIYFYENAL